MPWCLRRDHAAEIGIRCRRCETASPPVQPSSRCMPIASRPNRRQSANSGLDQWIAQMNTAEVVGAKTSLDPVMVPINSLPVNSVTSWLEQIGIALPLHPVPGVRGSSPTRVGHQIQQQVPTRRPVDLCRHVPRAPVVWGWAGSEAFVPGEVHPATTCQAPSAVAAADWQPLPGSIEAW